MSNIVDETKIRGLKDANGTKRHFFENFEEKNGTRDGSRTRKVYNRLILSQVRMPFRHPGVSGENPFS